MSYEPKNLKFSKEHEWVHIEGNVATIGITEYAAEQLGDVVHVNLPEVSSDSIKGTSIGEVESVKSVSDIFNPISGEITEVNALLVESPALVNEDPYGEGWIAKVAMTDTTELKDLMDYKGYQSFLSEEA